MVGAKLTAETRRRGEEGQDRVIGNKTFETQRNGGSGGHKPVAADCADKTQIGKLALTAGPPETRNADLPSS